MKPLVIYHADCTDGFGAAFAAWLKLGDEVIYQPMAYADTSPDVTANLCRDREVYILDFSFKKLVMEHIFEAAKRVVWLDHHKTAFEMWCGGYRKGDRFTAIPLGGADPLKHYVVLDDNFSGAYLAWEYFHPGTEVPMLIQHIDDYDRWQFKMRGTKEIARAIRSYQPWSFDQWEGLLLDEHYGSMCTEGGAILRAHNQNVQSALKQARLCVIIPAIIDSAASYKAPWAWGNSAEFGDFRFAGDFCFARGLAANAPAFLASDLGHELANKSGTFGLVWSMAGDGQIHCSLRSNGDYDVSAIAKVFGGGGHRNAAGFSTDIDTLVSWLK